MSEMVVAQGSLLDRIDNNISDANTHVEQAVEELDKVRFFFFFFVKL